MLEKLREILVKLVCLYVPNDGVYSDDQIDRALGEIQSYLSSVSGLPEKKNDSPYSSDPHICFENKGFNECHDLATAEIAKKAERIKELEAGLKEQLRIKVDLLSFMKTQEEDKLKIKSLEEEVSCLKHIEGEALNKAIAKIAHLEEENKKLSNSAQFRRVEEQQKRIEHLSDGLRKIEEMVSIGAVGVGVNIRVMDIAKEYLR